MSAITLTKHINAAPDKVFALSTDVPNFDKVVPAIKRIELLTPGPVTKGTRFRETRVMFGKEATETMEFTDFSPPKGYTIGCTSCGVQYRSRFDLRPSAAGTDLDLTIEYTPVTFMAKLLSPLTGMIMKSAMRKALVADLECLKKAAEST